MKFKNILKETNSVTRYKSKYFPPPTMDPSKIDWAEYSKKSNDVQSDMAKNSAWYEDGHNYDFKKATSKDIALGRHQYYIQFADFLYEKYEKRFYLVDFMTRINDDQGPDGLLYYITSADEIHLNLEGVTKEELAQATVGLGKKATTLTEIKAKYCTAWEINQIYYRDNVLNKTWFHTGSKLSKTDVYIAMNKKVPMSRILDDNKHLAYSN